MTSVISRQKHLRTGMKLCLLSLPLTHQLRKSNLPGSASTGHGLTGCSLENKYSKQPSRPPENSILSNKSCCANPLKFRGCLLSQQIQPMLTDRTIQKVKNSYHWIPLVTNISYTSFGIILNYGDMKLPIYLFQKNV